MLKKTLTIATTTAIILGVSSISYAAAPNPAKNEAAFKKLDTNNDSSISKEEFLATAQARFTKIDKNADGKISKEEFANRRGARKAKAAAPVTAK
jgi:Ca2+-binding EF-hand superfamily protein